MYYFMEISPSYATEPQIFFFKFDPDGAPCPHMSEVIESTILSKLGDTDKDRLIDCIKQPISSQQINIHPVQDNRPKTSLTSR